MNRIFYIHSNILTICCYQTIKECVEKNERVIIITNRGYSWPFFKGKVLVYDFSEIFKNEDKIRAAFHSAKAIPDYLRYRKYLSHLNAVVAEIIANEPFYFYLPSMALTMTAVFAYNKYCKGYYYVDEGYLAYSPTHVLQQYMPDRTKNLIKRLFRLEDHYHLELLSNFKGTISITNEAFSWNKDHEKIINPVTDFIIDIKDRIPNYDVVILTEYLTQDFEILKKGLDFAINIIKQEKPLARIGIKIHPQAITYNKEKTICIQNYLKEKYNGIIYFIPVDVSIEVMSLVYHSKLYSLLELSSIILYALIFKSSESSLIDYSDGMVSIKDIKTIGQYNEEKEISKEKVWS